MSAATIAGNQNGSAMIEKDMAAVTLGNTTNDQTPITGSATPMPLKPPFLEPLESSKPTPPPELTAEQEKQYESLLETAKSWTEIPAKDEKGGPITDEERMWLTKECLLRYLGATKWSSSEASKRLLGTLTWRREYGINDLTSEGLSIENETGKQFLLGYDNEGRPCHYMNPGRQNTDPSPRQVQHLVYMLERAIDMTIPGQGTLSLLVNFKTGKSKANSAPGLGLAKEVLYILQTHYPERLGRALIINIPWMVNAFFKLIMPFIDPVTKSKLKFNDDMRQHVPPQQLWTEWEGDLAFEYDHATYWPLLDEVCKQRHKERVKRWEAAGKHIGESENYLKGGDAPSVGESLKEAPPPPAYENAKEEQ